jgi:streptogramin lyase
VAAPDCPSAPNALARSCTVTLTGPVADASIAFDLNLARAASNEKRTESFVVKLPYSVGVLAGFVPSIPYTYAAAPDAGLTLDEAVPVAQGFQPLRLPADTAAFDGLSSVCARGAAVYFLAGRYVFKLGDGDATLFAGTAPVREQADQSHRLRLQITESGRGSVNARIACPSEGVIIADGARGTVVWAHEAGTVERLASGLDKPSYVAAAADGRIAVAVSGGTKILLIEAGKVSTLAELAPATAAGPLAFAPSGELTYFSADLTLHTNDVTLPLPRALKPVLALAYAANGDLYVSELDNATAAVSLLSRAGALTRVAGDDQSPIVSLDTYAGDEAVADGTHLEQPEGLAVGASGALFIAEAGQKRLRRLDADGKLRTVAGQKAKTQLCVAKEASELARLTSPLAATYAADGALLLVDRALSTVRASRVTSTLVERIDSCDSGAETFFSFLNQYAPPTDPAELDLSGDVALAPNGDVFVASYLSGIVRRLRASDYAADVVYQVPSAFGSGGSDFINYLSNPQTLPDTAPVQRLAIAVEASGKVLMTDDGQIMRFEPGATPAVLVPKTAGLQPTRIAVAPDGGIIVTEAERGLIRRVAADGSVATIAGNGSKGQTGDGGPALAASLGGPTALAVAANGDIVFADVLDGKGRVRLLKPGPDGYSIDTVLAQGENALDCGTGVVKATAAAAAVAGAIQTSASVLCTGIPKAVAVRDDCGAGATGQRKIAIVQSFGSNFANVLEITRPCD